jgi:D-alanine-D-alanine ligase
MKIAVLYDVWEEGGAPVEEKPPAEEPVPRARKRKKKLPPKRIRRPKLDREEIFDALVKIGHEPSYHVLDGKDASLVTLARNGADLLFNLTESYAGDDTRDMNIAAYLELLDRPFTGAGSHALYLAQDKALAKKIFQFHGLPTPYFAVIDRGKVGFSHDIQFPLIVKPTSEDGSIGIDAGSVVRTIKELMTRVEQIQERFEAPVLVEEYVEGREIYAAVIGNDRPEALPLVELDLSKLPEGMPRIAGTEVKWEKETEAYKKTKPAIASDLDEDLVRRIEEVAVGAYRALELRDYGRIDLRLAPDGKVFVIEANPNPWLSSSAEFAMAAKESGRSYHAMIREIVDLAMQRAS